MLIRLLVAVIVTALSWLSVFASVVDARNDEPGFAGIEFFGSSLITRAELEKELGLKSGARYESVSKACERLKEGLAHRHIDASVDVISEDGGYFVGVDVTQPGATGVPLRKLQSPHKVYLASELPFSTLAQLFARIDELHHSGRPLSESFTDGIKSFSDEPCNQLAKKLLQIVPVMRGQFFEVIASDPDPSRRSAAIEVLNWDTSPIQDCEALIPAVDDGSEQVRVSAVRYIYPRIKMLPDNFPMPELVEALSHQLARPSHIDQVLSLRSLLEIGRAHPFAVRAIQAANGERLNQLESHSLLSSIKTPAHELLQMKAPLAAPAARKVPAQLNEF